MNTVSPDLTVKGKVCVGWTGRDAHTSFGQIIKRIEDHSSKRKLLNVSADDGGGECVSHPLCSVWTHLHSLGSFSCLFRFFLQFVTSLFVIATSKLKICTRLHTHNHKACSKQPRQWNQHWIVQCYKVQLFKVKRSYWPFGVLLCWHEAFSLVLPPLAHWPEHRLGYHVAADVERSEGSPPLLPVYTPVITTNTRRPHTHTHKAQTKTRYWRRPKNKFWEFTSA